MGIHRFVSDVLPLHERSIHKNRRNHLIEGAKASLIVHFVVNYSL